MLSMLHLKCLPSCSLHVLPTGLIMTDTENGVLLQDRHIHSAPHALSKEQAADSAQPVGSRLCTSVPRGLLQASHPLCNAAPAALQRVRHLPFEGSNLSSLIEAAMQG